ncbi:MAG: VWA domain-containing protein, partial [Betaproteobacteria bacterium]|nr:VWA domain-containing protein [Betaproteobacteria bacterium]
MLLGDARQGKLLGNVSGFARALRRAGLAVDASRIALAAQAMQTVGLARRDDLQAALEAVLVGQERDRAVFRELFDTFFRDPAVASKLLAQMLPTAEGRADPPKQRPRVREALAAPRAARDPRQQPEQAVEFDACMTAGTRRQLRHADFNALGAAEYRLLERLAREVPLPLPQLPGRRLRAGQRGARADWPRLLRQAARCGGECMELPRLQRRREAPPLLILVDVPGSMERYTRLLLAFLPAATRGLRRRDVFAVGTSLTDLTPAFALPDSD